ncbi:MAG: DUF4160 domain-containing protein [Rhodoferax sp.]|nr:DUF4160 domain-containing protein [Rhodoferax sp.]
MNLSGFFFYSDEGNPREAMHIDVRNPDGEAKFWLVPTVYLADSVLAGRPDLSRRGTRLSA